MPAPASTPVEFTVTADPTTADVPVRFPTETLGVPDNPVALPVTLPVTFPIKVVAVIIPE